MGESLGEKGVRGGKEGGGGGGTIYLYVETEGGGDCVYVFAVELMLCFEITFDLKKWGVRGRDVFVVCLSSVGAYIPARVVSPYTVSPFLGLSFCPRCLNLILEDGTLSPLPLPFVLLRGVPFVIYLYIIQS